MHDDKTTVSELKALVANFVAVREWQKYHRPKNLAMSLAIEAAELMEHFQWVDHSQAEAMLANPDIRAEVAEEMADVLAFLLSLYNCMELDLAAALEAKMAKNEQKYPSDKVRGNYQRPRPAGQ
jgi:NTP pyrophosphatase (non-canonical NTP hydrolase)